MRIEQHGPLAGYSPRRLAPWVGLTALASLCFAQATSVPTDVQLPGTQPGEVQNLEAPSKCDNCHGGYDPAVEPAHNWRGSLMAHASRDPLFWATVAVAEQDFDGSGDLCLRCHVSDGWVAGRSTPTDGSGLQANDATGVSCDLCHQLTDPDGLEVVGVQNDPFVANDGGSPPEGYYGSGEFVLLGGGTKLGPYDDAFPPHNAAKSLFHRSPDLCGTCHDVSNPVTGDLAPGHGAQLPLAPGTYSGVPGAPVDGKAAFNNPPYAYGITERTYSEHMASAFPTLRVGDYDTLPPELQAGSIETAWEAAMASTPTGDYADGTPRTFTCQTCHMPPRTGKGCNKNTAPVRSDVPLHDLTGGNTWVPDLIQHQDDLGQLVFGGGMTPAEVAGLAAGKARAQANLEDAAGLEVIGDQVRVVNRTGHKLLSGYPEGRRMWLHVEWFDAFGTLVREDGAYGALNATVLGQPEVVESLLDPDDPHTHVWEAKMGITQEWAARLVALGLPPTLALGYDRTTGVVEHTLGELAAQPPGSAQESFHFVLNDAVLADNRIPPYGMDYLAARDRNCLPVPEDQFGGPGGTYEHWVDVPLDPPSEAVSATISLHYQVTSWEYVQFLLLANDGSVGFLAQEGTKLFESWKATGMAAPVLMASTTWGAGCDPDFTASCAAKPNSAGCTPVLSASGLPTLSGPDDFHVLASDVLGQTKGWLTWSLAPLAAAPTIGGVPGHPTRGFHPFGGRQCLAAPQYFGSAFSGGTPGECDGVLDFALTQAFFAQHGLLAGTTVHVQAWSQDPTHPDGSGLGHTGALAFTLCP